MQHDVTTHPCGAGILSVVYGDPSDFVVTSSTTSCCCKDGSYVSGQMSSNQTSICSTPSSVTSSVIYDAVCHHRLINGLQSSTNQPMLSANRDVFTDARHLVSSKSKTHAWYMSGNRGLISSNVSLTTASCQDRVVHDLWSCSPLRQLHRDLITVMNDCQGFMNLVSPKPTDHPSCFKSRNASNPHWDWCK